MIRSCSSRVRSSAHLPAAMCRSLRNRARNSAASFSATTSCFKSTPSRTSSSKDVAFQRTIPNQWISCMSRKPPGERLTLGSSIATVCPNFVRSIVRASVKRSAFRSGARRAWIRRCFRRRSTSSALPANRRQSSSALNIVASAAANCWAPLTVRTLCPTSNPASKRSCSSRLATLVTS